MRSGHHAAEFSNKNYNVLLWKIDGSGYKYSCNLVIEGKDMKNRHGLGHTHPQVKLSTGTEVKETKRSKGEAPRIATFNIVWNETLVLNILPGQTTVNVTIEDEGFITDKAMAFGTLNLDPIFRAGRQDLWLEIRNKDKFAGSVKLNCFFQSNNPGQAPQQYAPVVAQTYAPNPSAPPAGSYGYAPASQAPPAYGQPAYPPTQQAYGAPGYPAPYGAAPPVANYGAQPQAAYPMQPAPPIGYAQPAPYGAPVPAPYGAPQAYGAPVGFAQPAPYGAPVPAPYQQPYGAAYPPPGQYAPQQQGVYVPPTQQGKLIL